MIRRNVLILVVLIIFLAIQACATSPVPMFYRGAEIKGQVVDSETKKPIEGAAVVAQWELYCENPVDGSYCKMLHVYEAVTDKEGRYRIPSWGPKMRPSRAYLDTYDPKISFFKKDYSFLTVYNSDPVRFNKTFGHLDIDKIGFEEYADYVSNNEYEHHRSLRESVWDGKTIELKRFEGSNEDLDFMLNRVYSRILDKEREGILIKRVKNTAIEWSKAVREVQPPFNRKELPDQIEKVLREENR